MLIRRILRSILFRLDSTVGALRQFPISEDDPAEVAWVGRVM